MSAKAPAWSREFAEPIPLPDSRELRTLADAGHYVTALPPAVRKRAVWQVAAEVLIEAATEQWPVRFADIAMRKALNADKPVSTGLAIAAQIGHSASRQGSIRSCANPVLRSGGDAAGRKAALVQDQKHHRRQVRETSRPTSSPMMSYVELLALSEDIKKNGMRVSMPASMACSSTAATGWTAWRRSA